MLDKFVKGIISLTTNVFVPRLGAGANIVAVGVACCRPLFSVCCHPLFTLLTINFFSVFLAIFCLCCVLR